MSKPRSTPSFLGHPVSVCSWASLVDTDHLKVNTGFSRRIYTMIKVNIGKMEDSFIIHLQASRGQTGMDLIFFLILGTFILTHAVQW